ncbi:MarC family protein [Rhodovulum sp. DZ06]|uniref:MarC family protein n=1 Tax=Rhodovulum sp. DZ06 TaxID=3425126 RepID=UPI003D32B30F
MPEISELFREFIALWVVIDPIGTLPVFIAVTAGLAASERKRVARKAVLVATAVLLAFILVGQFVLEGLGIALPSFQLAGGMVLFLFALTMIFGDGKPASELHDDGAQGAVFPLAIPSIASPGAMLAAVVLTDNNRFSVAEQAVTAGLVVVVALATWGILLAANPILRVIGRGGAAVVSRVMGMILAAVAVDACLGALVTIGVVPAF